MRGGICIADACSRQRVQLSRLPVSSAFLIGLQSQPTLQQSKQGVGGHRGECPSPLTPWCMEVSVQMVQACMMNALSRRTALSATSPSDLKLCRTPCPPAALTWVRSVAYFELPVRAGRAEGGGGRRQRHRPCCHRRTRPSANPVVQVFVCTVVVALLVAYGEFHVCFY